MQSGALTLQSHHNGIEIKVLLLSGEITINLQSHHNGIEIHNTRSTSRDSTTFNSTIMEL